MMRFRWTAWIVLASATPVCAQSASNQVDLRVGKLEREMRAVQRKVFPQGVPVQPELTPSTAPTATGTPASAPLSDLTSRVDALEKQVAALTGQVEQNGFRVRQMDEALTRVQARLTVLESGSTPVAATPRLSVEPTAATTTHKPATGVTRPTTTAEPKATPPKSDPLRKSAVAAIEIPASGDAVEDAYTYGFRLYDAKFYPEAQAKLKEFVAKYPVTSRRWSYAQNLLGRAYFDEGKPALAAVALYDNYQKAPRGERASESLYWLGQSLTKLKKLPDACKVYAELLEVYAAKLTAEQKARAAKGKADAKCAA